MYVSLVPTHVRRRAGRSPAPMSRASNDEMFRSTHAGRCRLAVMIMSVLCAGLAASGSTFAQSSSVDPDAWIRHPSRPFSIRASETTVAQFRACIDAGACDASSANEQCNLGREGRNAHPVNCVTFHGAEAYCAWANGRICTEDEWLAACRGTEDRAYPYGQAFDAAACNVHSNALAVAGERFDTVAVGSTETCVGGLSGLVDMAGNVGEWIDACKDSYCKFRGAGYLSNDPIDLFTGCGGVCSGNQKTLMSGVVGIRCCRDESPD
jgi:formylglycine-generating enzyme required for sulfatase activity